MKECPVDGCGAQIFHTMLACKRHWFKLPKPLRDAIWQTHRDGMGAAYRANVREAHKIWADLAKQENA